MDPVEPDETCRPEPRHASTSWIPLPRVGAPVHPVPRRSRGALQGYVVTVLVADLVAVCLAELVAVLIALVVAPGRAPTRGIVVMALLPLVWVTVASFYRAYEERYLGQGSEEFARVARASLAVVAVVASSAWLLHLDVARGFVVLSCPLAAVASLLLRYACRRRLHRARERGHHLRPLLVVGRADAAAATVRLVKRATYHGLDVVGVCLESSGSRPDRAPWKGPGGSSGRRESDVIDTLARAELDALGVPVLGGLEETVDVVRRYGIQVVAVLPTGVLQGAKLRELGWELEETGTELLISASVTEAVGPRVAIRPVVGMPLIHVDRAELTGIRRWLKGALDRVVALVALVVLAPVFLVVAAAIRLDTPGQVFFRQSRVGKDGCTFGMVKFRSMVSGADSMLPQGRTDHDGNAVLFKLRDDPRVSRVGRFLRRTSLDELPQLVNVLVGHMSLVGPRPPLASEVELYGADARRRLLVKPGLTGLWQINGRSDLDWDESVRLDLRYVENWSFAFDAVVVWKTLGAVIASRGAY